MAIPDRIGREVSMIRVFTQSLSGNTHNSARLQTRVPRLQRLVTVEHFAIRGGL